MKFIHAADIHLGHLFQGVKKISQELQNEFKEATFNAFKKVIDSAISEQVDFVILAGDEYDRHQRSLKEQNFLRDQFIRLQENQIDVFMVYGNHDYLTEESTYIKFPENVYAFNENVQTKEIITKNNERVSISGFSYDQQNISKNYLPEYPSKQTDEDFHLGILHGMVQSQSKNYAPFDITDMISKGYEYWALGHIHKREVLNQNPMIAYSGNSQGLNRTEMGDKGFYLVEMQNGKTDMKFIKSHIFLWDQLSITVDESDSIDDIKNKIMNHSEKMDENTLLSITIGNSQRLTSELQDQIEDNEFLEYIQPYLQNNKIYAYKIKPKYNNDSLFEDMDKEFWDKSKNEIYTIENVRNLDTKLMKYDMIRNHIEEDGFLDDLVQKSGNALNHEKEGR